MKRVGPSLIMLSLVLSVAHDRAWAQSEIALRGVVRDPHGTPQLGALVELLGPGLTVVAHTYTDDHGRYWLSALQPGRYQLRTSAAFLLPTLRKNIRLTTGIPTLADITLTALFGAGDWFPVERRGKDEPGDDWRWTLRSTAERPLLRLVPTDEGEPAAAATSAVSGAERATSETAQKRFETAFGSAGLLQDGWRQTIGLDREHANGSVTQFQSTLGDPAAGERASSFAVNAGYEERNAQTRSEFRAVAALASYPEVGAAGGPGFQAVNLATGERIVLGDVVTIDAGTLLSAERLVASRLSTAPFLRVALHPSPSLTIMYRYAGSRALQSLDDLDDTRLATEPISDSRGRPVGRTASHNEVAVSHHAERNAAVLAIYQDAFAAGFAEGGGGLSLADTNSLPVTENTSSGTFIVGLHGYMARGVSGSWTRTLTPSLKAVVQGDFGTTTEIKGDGPASLSGLQSSITTCNVGAVTAELEGALLASATSFDVRYHWQPTRTLALVNSFNAAANQAYLGITVKQGLWHGDHVRGVSAVVEASNLLEEGYQPMVGPDGRTLFLAQVPRSLQARLVFSF